MIGRVGLALVLASAFLALGVSSASAATASNAADGLGCGFLYEQRSAAFLEPNPRFGLEPDVHYGLSVRYCPQRTGPPKIAYADIDLKTRYPKSNLNALSRTIGDFFLSVRHRWRPAKGRSKAVVTTSADRLQIRAQSGHFDLCVIPLPGIAGRLAKGAGRAFKWMPKSWRRKAVKTVVSKPAKAAIKRTLTGIRTAERRVIERKLRAGGMTKRQARQSSLREAKQRLETRKALYYGLIEIIADSFIKLKFAEVCVQAWKPELIATIPTFGRPRMQVRSISGRLGSGLLAQDWRTGFVDARPNPRDMPIGPGET